VSHQILAAFEQRLAAFVKKETGRTVEVFLSGADIGTREAAFLAVKAAYIHGEFARQHPIDGNHAMNCSTCKEVFYRACASENKVRQFVEDHIELIAELRLEEKRRG